MKRVFRKMWNLVLITITALAIWGLAASVCVLLVMQSWEAFTACIASAIWLTVFALANGGPDDDM